MSSIRTAILTLICLLVTTIAVGRSWSDKSGKHQVEAELVTVKEGKVYLEKADGTVTAVDLDKLSQADLDYLRSLPQYAEQLSSKAPGEVQPPPRSGGEPLERPSGMAVIHVPDESHVGEIRLFQEASGIPLALTFSPNGAWLALGVRESALMIFDVDASKMTGLYSQLDALGAITCVAFSPDGKKLLTGGERGRIQVWNFADGSLNEGKRFFGHSASVRTITVCRDGRTVFSGGDDRVLRCWDLDTARERFTIDGFYRSIGATFLTPSGKQGLGCDSQALVLVDVRAGKAIQAMPLLNTWAAALAVSPEGSRVALTHSGALRMWDIRSGRELPPLVDGEMQFSVAFLPNGRYLLSGGRGQVNLWEIATQQKIYEFDVRSLSNVEQIAVSPDNRHFAVMGHGTDGLQVFRLPADVAGR